MNWVFAKLWIAIDYGLIRTAGLRFGFFQDFEGY
jgi:hypothetical protein